MMTRSESSVLVLAVVPSIINKSHETKMVMLVGSPSARDRSHHLSQLIYPGLVSHGRIYWTSQRSRELAGGKVQHAAEVTPCYPI